MQEAAVLAVKVQQMAPVAQAAVVTGHIEAALLLVLLELLIAAVAVAAAVTLMLVLMPVTQVAQVL